MKRTDLSTIMRTAWQMCRATGAAFAECLHKAWQVFKLKIKMRAGHCAVLLPQIEYGRIAAGIRYAQRCLVLRNKRLRP